MSLPAPARKFVLLLALGAATLAAWKLGALEKASASAKQNSLSANSPVSPGESTPGYIPERKDSKCCDKPPSKAALLQNP